MKTVIIAFFSIAFLHCASGQSDTNADDFQKLTNPAEREKIIQQAPASQKEELRKIDLHLRLRSKYGSEDAIKMFRGMLAVENRGFRSLQRLFSEHWNLWQMYMSLIILENRRVESDIQKSATEERKLQNEGESYAKQQAIEANALLLTLAATPEALALERRAETVLSRIRSMTVSTGGPTRPITKQEREAIDKEVDGIFEQLRILPKLSSQDVQRQIEAVPELKLLR